MPYLSELAQRDNHKFILGASGGSGSLGKVFVRNAQGKMTNMIVSVIGVGSALLAAFFWLWASLVLIPPWPDVGWYLDAFAPFRACPAKSFTPECSRCGFCWRGRLRGRG
jgi:hypothetical protein